VRQDWHAELPAEKLQVYVYALAQAQPAYDIFSIALDEALLLRRSGRHEMARDQADVSAELCLRFAAALECLLNVVERHANNFGLVPSVNPLDPLFFAGETARRAAARNSLLSTVLFGQRTRFLHKVRTLGEMAGNIAEEYRVMAVAVSDGVSSSKGWDHLSTLQYDLTTSLSETTVMLKSFIVSLPSKEVMAFRDRLADALLALESAPAVTDRRAPAYRRE
jgi:hypothetical protein